MSIDVKSIPTPYRVGDNPDEQAYKLRVTPRLCKDAFFLLSTCLFDAPFYRQLWDAARDFGTGVFMFQLKVLATVLSPVAFPFLAMVLARENRKIQAQAEKLRQEYLSNADYIEL